MVDHACDPTPRGGRGSRLLLVQSQSALGFRPTSVTESNQKKGAREMDGSVIKSIWLLSQRTQVYSQYPHESTTVCNSSPEDLKLSFGLLRYQGHT